MAQLMLPLPLTVSCFSKIQIGFTFLVPAYLGSPGKRADKRVCVCVSHSKFVDLLSHVQPSSSGCTQRVQLTTRFTSRCWWRKMISGSSSSSSSSSSGLLMWNCCRLSSHRPVDVHNVYNQVQVKMLMKEDDCDNIPAFEDVFRDDEDEDEQEASWVAASQLGHLTFLPFSVLKMSTSQSAVMLCALTYSACG